MLCVAENCRELGLSFSLMAIKVMLLNFEQSIYHFFYSSSAAVQQSVMSISLEV
jgi:hypothetical protein